MSNRTRWRLLVVAGLIAVIAGTYYFLSFPEREVTAALSSIPRVRVRSVWGDTHLPPKWYYAKIEVAGRPSAFIFRLTRRSFDQVGEFCFFQVGDYAVRYTAFGSFWDPRDSSQATLANAFCFDGSGGVSDGLDLFPVRIQNVQDFVQNIGTVQDTLAQWPRCPNFKDLTGPRGRYRLCTNPDVSTDVWPPYGWEK